MVEPDDIQPVEDPQPGSGRKEHDQFVNLGDLFRRLHSQTITLRSILFGVCLLFIVLILGLQVYMFIGENAGLCWEQAPLTALIVTPIASVTAVMIFLLIGVFRGYTDNDMKKAPALKLAEYLADNMVR